MIRSWAILMVLVVTGGAAQAHFLWIEATSHASGESVHVEAGFGEVGGWDADYAEKIANARYFAFGSDGASEDVSLEWSDESEAYVGSANISAPAAVAGVSVWGLFGRGGSAPSLLTYFSKSVAGSPEEWASLPPSDRLVVEILPKYEAGSVTLTVLADGKPLPDAEVKLYGPESDRNVVRTDENGDIHWSLEGAGDYSAFVGRKTKRTGEYEGAAYEGEMHYATLTFRIAKD